MWSTEVVDLWIKEELKKWKQAATTNHVPTLGMPHYATFYSEPHVAQMMRNAIEAVKNSYEQIAAGQGWRTKVVEAEQKGWTSPLYRAPLDGCSCGCCQKQKMEEWLTAVDEAFEEVEEEDDSVHLVLSPGTVVRISVEK